nr:PREDICTED: PTI1-like tyrosine-protein kinase 1 [Daucus carota subsp. sativus]
MLRRWAVYLENKDQEEKSCYQKSESDDQKSVSKSCVISGCSSVVKTYTFEELKEATRDFRIRIGVGATSFVYLAQLEDGIFGAVKRVMEDRGGSKKMFLDEVSILLRISHPNLVGMMGFCLEQGCWEEGLPESYYILTETYTETGEQLLLLEYVPNKSLYDRMHTQQGQCRGTLSWSNRVSIALDLARALDYLHNVADPPVIHRDIKSSNILLVNNNRAKLADFGLCKLGHDIQTAPLTPTTIKGSLGYVDTNYLNTGLLSPKSDVYSFGVILLELVTGLKSFLGSTTIAEWTEECRKNQNVDVLVGLLDPKLKGDADLEQLKVLIELANLALLENAEARPDMKFIVSTLLDCTEDKLQPELPV